MPPSHSCIPLPAFLVWWEGESEKCKACGFTLEQFNSWNTFKKYYGDGMNIITMIIIINSNSNNNNSNNNNNNGEKKTNMRFLAVY